MYGRAIKSPLPFFVADVYRREILHGRIVDMRACANF